MPEAEPFEAPKGSTFFGRYLETITEAFVGNGITNNGDAEVTADPNTAMGIEVAAANSLSYDANTYSPSADSFTLSDGPTSSTGGQDDRRVDMVYFDADTTSYAVLEGTPDPNPEPPSTPSNGLMLALVAVPHESTNINDTDIQNWRAHPAASAIRSEGFKATPGTTTFGPLFDIPVESSTPQGTEISYTFTVDGETFAKIVTESDGSGGIESSNFNIEQTLNVNDTAFFNFDTFFNSAAFFNSDVSMNGGATINDDVTMNGDVVLASSNSITFAPSTQFATAVTNPLPDSGNDGDFFNVAFKLGGSEVLSYGGFSDGSGFPEDISVNTNYPFTVNDELTINSPSTFNGDMTVNGDILPPESGGLVYRESSGNVFAVDKNIPSSGTSGDFYSVQFGMNQISIISYSAEDDGSGGLNNISAAINYPVDINGEATFNGGINLNTGVEMFGSTTLISSGGVIQRSELSRPTDRVSWSLSRPVSQTDQRVAATDALADGETIEIDKATFTLKFAQAVPSGVNLELVTFDNSGNYTTQSTILLGDGSTVYDDETGSPLASYENTTGSEQSVGVIIDNTTNNSQDITAGIEGRTGR